jgi:hypothetical protein
MSCCGGPHFSCCAWRVGFACDRWGLFLLLWLLCLGHMRFDLLFCLSGLCLPWGLSKLIWQNLGFSTSEEVGVFCWVWCLIWSALVWGGACDSPWFQGEYDLLHWETMCLVCCPPEFRTCCVSSLWLDWRGSLCLILYDLYYCFSLAFSSYSPKSLGFTCYISWYLLNYAYHCARMSRNEMSNPFARPC